MYVVKEVVVSHKTLNSIAYEYGEKKLDTPSCLASSVMKIVGAAKSQTQDFFATGPCSNL